MLDLNCTNATYLSDEQLEKALSARSNPTLAYRRYSRFRFLRWPVDQLHRLGYRETGNGDIEIEIFGQQLLQLIAQYLPVPPRIQRQPIVGYHIGALVCLAHRVDTDGRHFFEAHGARRGDAPVAGQDLPVLVDDDGIGEAEAADAGDDLLDLRLRVAARSIRPGLEIGKVRIADLRHATSPWSWAAP